MIDINEIITRQYSYAALRIRIHESVTPKSHVQLDNSWAEYVSKLVTHSYGNDEKVRQAIFDALSPFQIASKIWAANLLLNQIKSLNPQRIVFVGSWFGQLAAMMDSSSPTPWGYEGIQKILLDKDPRASSIALDCSSTIGRFMYMSQDVFDFSDEFPVDEDTIIVWTGIEHFDKKCVAEMIASWSVLGCRFLLQGTDMPDKDHINPVTSVADLLHYFHGGSETYMGRMETKLGSRFMVAYTT